MIQPTTPRKPFFRLLAALLMLGLLVPVATAQVLSAESGALLEQRVNEFIMAPGHTGSEVDPDDLLHDWYTPERFPNATSSVFQPDANLDPFSKAVLLVDSQESPLLHARYLITYLYDTPIADRPETGLSLVEVTRFNLGPARHEAVTSEHGIDAAPLEEFGVGPDVSWRFVFTPIQGQRSHVTGVSRRELTRAEAAAADCLGVPCLELASPEMPAGEFEFASGDTPEFSWPTPYVSYPAEGGVALPARTAAEMLSAATYGQGALEPSEGGTLEPQLTLVLSWNVDGQDSNSDSVLREGRIMDHSIEEVWWQRLEAGEHLEWQFVPVPRANPH